MSAMSMVPDPVTSPYDNEGARLVDLQRKKELERRAFQVCLLLCQPKIVAVEVITAALPQIQTSHYKNVIEERAIGSEICGYPLCDVKLKSRGGRLDVKKNVGRYRIDSKKVYNTEDFKNFCGKECFAASNHVSNQISELPLGLRPSDSEMPTVSFLGHGSHPMPKVARPKPRQVVASPATVLQATLIIQEKKETTSEPVAPTPNPLAHTMVEGYQLGTAGNPAITESLLLAASQNRAKKSFKNTNGSSSKMSSSENNNNANITNTTTNNNNSNNNGNNDNTTTTNNNNNNNNNNNSNDGNHEQQPQQQQLQQVDRESIDLWAEFDKALKLVDDQKSAEEAAKTEAWIGKSRLDRFEQELRIARDTGMLNVPKQTKTSPPKPKTVSASVNMKSIRDVLVSWRTNATIELLKSKNATQWQNTLQKLRLVPFKPSPAHASNTQPITTPLPPPMTTTKLPAPTTTTAATTITTPPSSLPSSPLSSTTTTTTTLSSSSSLSSPLSASSSSCSPTHNQPPPHPTTAHNQTPHPTTTTTATLPPPLFSTADIDIIEQEKAGKAEKSATPHFPLLDNVSQFTIRSHLLQQQLDRVIPKVLAEFQLNPKIVRNQINELISTFEVHRETVTFQPAEYVVLSIVLLAVIAPVVPPLASAFALAHQGVTRRDRWLRRMHMSRRKFDSLVNALTNMTSPTSPTSTTSLTSPTSST